MMGEHKAFQFQRNMCHFQMLIIVLVLLIYMYASGIGVFHCAWSFMKFSGYHSLELSYWTSVASLLVVWEEYEMHFQFSLYYKKWTEGANEELLKTISVSYAKSSSREWRPVGTPTTDWELFLKVHWRKSQYKQGRSGISKARQFWL